MTWGNSLLALVLRKQKGMMITQAVIPLPDQLTMAGKSDSKQLLEIYILCEMFKNISESLKHTHKKL